MKENLTNRFIDNLFRLKKEHIPEEVYTQAKICLISHIGSVYAGKRILGSKIDRLVEDLDIDAGMSTIIGYNKKNSIHNTVLLNSLMCHASEIDDGERFGMVHPGATVIPAVLAKAESENLNGVDILFGIIVGYEAVISLAHIMQPALKLNGYHATGICGSIGAAMGVAFSLGLSNEKVKATLSAAGTASSGLLETIMDGSDLKPFNAANASLAGLMSVNMGLAGFEGPNDVLGGERGLVKNICGNRHNDLLPISEQNSFKINEIYLKPYAACRHSHSAIDSTLKILSDHDFALSDIETITVETYDLAVRGHEHKSIPNINSAKMSIPFSIAVALIYGKAGVLEFSKETLENREIYSLMDKMTIKADAELSSRVPKERGARVLIKLSNKESFNAEVVLPKGEPETQITSAEINDLFIDLLIYGGKTLSEAKTLLNCIWDIENRFQDLMHNL